MDAVTGGVHKRVGVFLCGLLGGEDGFDNLTGLCVYHHVMIAGLLGVVVFFFEWLGHAVFIPMFYTLGNIFFGFGRIFLAFSPQRGGSTGFFSSLVEEEIIRAGTTPRFSVVFLPFPFGEAVAGELLGRAAYHTK